MQNPWSLCLILIITGYYIMDEVVIAESILKELKRMNERTKELSDVLRLVTKELSKIVVEINKVD